MNFVQPKHLFYSLALLLCLSPGISRAQAPAADDAIADLDCKNIRPRPAKDVVLDPAYYRDAINGLITAEGKIKEYVRDTGEPTFDIAKTSKDFALMNGWLAPAAKTYAQIRNDVLPQLRDCFRGSACKGDTGGPAQQAKIVENTANVLKNIKDVRDDMVKVKLAALKKCDPAEQIKSGNNSFADKLADLQTKLKPAKEITDAQADADTYCNPPATTNIVGMTDGGKNIQAMVTQMAAQAKPAVSAHPYQGKCVNPNEVESTQGCYPQAECANLSTPGWAKVYVNNVARCFPPKPGVGPAAVTAPPAPAAPAVKSAAPVTPAASTADEFEEFTD